jgi:hypothetical protein
MGMVLEPVLDSYTEYYGDNIATETLYDDADMKRTR